MPEDSIFIGSIAGNCTTVLLYEGMASANCQHDCMLNALDRLWPVYL